jgi:hypothetical protein
MKERLRAREDSRLSAIIGDTSSSVNCALANRNWTWCDTLPKKGEMDQVIVIFSGVNGAFHEISEQIDGSALVRQLL